MLKQQKKWMVTGGIGIILIVIMAYFITTYLTIAPAFRTTVAIVEQDEQDTAEIKAVQQATKPDMLLVEPDSEEVLTTVVTFNRKGMSTQSASAVPTAIYAQEKIDKSITNILLLMDGNFFLLSYNKQHGRPLLLTIDPAVLLPVQGYGWTTLADSYEIGGLPCVINTLNQALALDINEYIFVNGAGIWSMSDRMGGLEMMLTQREADELNRLLGTVYTAGETVMWTGGLEVYTQLTIDGDAIVHWQKACKAIVDKAKEKKQLKELKKAVFNSISTNLSVLELKETGEAVLQNQEIEQQYFPEESERKLLEGKMVLDIDLEASRQSVKRYLYAG